MQLRQIALSYIARCLMLAELSQIETATTLRAPQLVIDLENYLMASIRSFYKGISFYVDAVGNVNCKYLLSRLRKECHKWQLW